MSEAGVTAPSDPQIRPEAIDGMDGNGVLGILDAAINESQANGRYWIRTSDICCVRAAL
jgi:hypothetical protein